MAVRAVAAAILLCSSFWRADSKIYDRCELAHELRDVHDIPEHQLATWLCIANYESHFDTAAHNHGSGDHGLFQISEIYWCSPPGNGLACGISCASLKDDDIEDDVICAKRIYRQHQRISGDGFTAWVVYNRYCRNRAHAASFLDGCFDYENLVNKGYYNPVYAAMNLPTVMVPMPSTPATPSSSSLVPAMQPQVPGKPPSATSTPPGPLGVKVSVPQTPLTPKVPPETTARVPVRVSTAKPPARLQTKPASSTKPTTRRPPVRASKPPLNVRSSVPQRIKATVPSSVRPTTPRPPARASSRPTLKRKPSAPQSTLRTFPSSAVKLTITPRPTTSTHKPIHRPHSTSPRVSVSTKAPSYQQFLSQVSTPRVSTYKPISKSPVNFRISSPSGLPASVATASRPTTFKPFVQSSSSALGTTRSPLFINDGEFDRTVFVKPREVRPFSSGPSAKFHFKPNETVYAYVDTAGSKYSYAISSRGFKLVWNGQ